MQKKNKFKELKLIFMTSLTFSIKKIINQSQSENKNDNNILNYAILKLVTLFISNSLGNFLSDKFHKEEDVVINDIISLSSANFNNNLTHYVLKKVEKNIEFDNIKFEYYSSFENILRLNKCFIETCYSYIKIITHIISMYLIPFTTKEITIVKYLKITFVNMYLVLLFHLTFKRCNVNTMSPHSNGITHVDDFFYNLDKMIEKDTLKEEIKILNKIIIKDVFNNKKKYENTKLSKEMLKKSKLYQLYETLLSIIVNDVSVIAATDRSRTAFEGYANSMMQFKVLLNDANFFIKIMRTKSHKQTNKMEWNDNYDNNNVFTLKNITLEYFSNKSNESNESNESETTKNVILKDVNLDFEVGKVHYIGGSSGSGKSTLLLALIKRIKIKNGSLLWFGLYEFSYLSIRKYITYITCQTTLFNKSLYFNIVYGINKNVLKEQNDTIMQTIKKYMRCLNLKEFIPVLKNKNANELSKGQEQRIIIVSLFLDVIYNSKKILFLDEITSNLDADNEIVVYQELMKLKEMYNLTIFYISHNADNIIYSDYNYKINPTTHSIHKELTIIK